MEKFNLKVRLTLLLFSSACLGAGITFAQTNTTPGALHSSQRIIVIAHRGEHLHHPENTLPAYQAAIDAGADYIEVDVRTTSDGKMVLMHDSTVNRTTNGTGSVASMTSKQVLSLDAGAKFSSEFLGTKIPTFDQALGLAYGKIGIYVDTKDADPHALVDAIKRHNMQEHVVIYGSTFFLMKVHRISPALKVMPEAVNVIICSLEVKILHPKVLAFGSYDFTNQVIDCAKKANAQIYVDRLGTTDNPDGWQKAIDMGANGIQTNRPAELVEYLRAHNMATH